MTIFDYIFIFSAFALIAFVVEKKHLPQWVYELSTMRAVLLSFLILVLSVIIGVTLNLILIPIICTLFLSAILSKNVRERSNSMKERL